MRLTAFALRDFDPGEGARLGAAADEAPGEWIACPAPGDVYLALHAAGRLPHPFKDQNEYACAWVRAREWWQRTHFDAPKLKPGERLALRFEGLDTFATIYLNGQELGRTDNMFRAYEYDITDSVRTDRANTLAIAFTPPSEIVKGRQAPVWPMIADSLAASKRNLMRKAQFGWGWDWGPDLPTVGIWKPVELLVRRRASLDSVTLRTLSLASDHASAEIEIAADIRRISEAPLTLHVTLTAPDGRVALTQDIAVSGDKAAHRLTLRAPQLWWTHDLGGPALYTLSAALRAGDQVVDSRTLQTGVRTIELDTAPDPEEPGADFFRFVLNGQPIFARGACWIPASSFVGALTRADYKVLIDAAAHGHMNMLRIWGGGVYEHDAFYELCDEAGVLVWQDFMFACAPYPQDKPAFVESVREEVRQQITRLRHRPSIALWCGNNEVQMIHSVLPRGPDGQKPPLGGELYFDEIMPEGVEALDPTTPYWPGSPFGGPLANSMRAGDVHDWTVWHGAPPIPHDRMVGRFSRAPEAIAYTRYAEDMGRFISEFGIHAAPALETLRRAMPEDQLRYGSEGLLHRIKDHPKDKVNGMLVSVTGLPQTLQEYIDYTQITQAEGLKFGVEHFRRRMPHCSGTLIWQHNDCWPCTSWSLLDYHGVAKASFYVTRRAYAPAIATFKPLDNGDVELWLTNEAPRPLSAALTVELGDFQSGALWREDIAVEAPGYSSAPVWRAPRDKLAPSPARYLNVRAEADAVPENRHFFAPIKDLALPRDAAPAVSIVQRDAQSLAVTIEAPAYLYMAHALTPHADARCSDNYFDLRKGQRRTILVTRSQGPLAPGDIRVRCPEPTRA